MNLNEYQEFTKSTAVYNTTVRANGKGFTFSLFPEMYPVLALCEEAGEVAGKYAKFIRKLDNSAKGDGDKLRSAVVDELGDVLYNLSEIARQIGVPLQQVLDRNVEKLTDRKARNVIVGDGDNR
jgi:NTP pyrophosphatase (non-canonical NTP hydrolase)